MSEHDQEYWNKEAAEHRVADDSEADVVSLPPDTGWSLVLMDGNMIDAVIGPFHSEDAADFWAAEHEVELHPWEVVYVATKKPTDRDPVPNIQPLS